MNSLLDLYFSISAFSNSILLPFHFVLSSILAAQEVEIIEQAEKRQESSDERENGDVACKSMGGILADLRVTCGWLSFEQAPLHMHTML